MGERGIVLINGLLADGIHDELLEGRAVVISKGFIKEIVPSGEADRYKDYKKIDLKGCTLLPGLIDAHVHLAGCRGDEFSAFAIHPQVRAYKAYSQALNLLRYGFTSLRDISVYGLYLKRNIYRGDLPGPRIIACGPGLSRRGGHSDIHELPFKYVEKDHFWGVFADGREEIRRTVRELIREGADQIKIWASGGGNNAVDRIDDPHYTLDEIKACVEEARMIQGTRVLAHAEERVSIKMCLEAGVDSLEHGEDLTEELCDRMVKQGTCLVPTLNLIANWYEDFVTEEKDLAPGLLYGPFFYRDIHRQVSAESYSRRALESFRLAYERGVKIALGSDSVDETITPYGEYSIKELLFMIKAGMKPMDALKAATIRAAEVLGIDGFTGSVQTGKVADILAVKGNPLENINLLLNPGNLRFVMQEGIIRAERGKIVLSQ